MSRTRTYVDKLLGDTEYLLEQWGWWRMDGMGFPDMCRRPPLS